MMMCVDKARRDDFVGAVDDFGTRWSSKFWSYFGDKVVFDQKVGVFEWFDGIVSFVDEDCAVAEKDGHILKTQRVLRLENCSTLTTIYLNLE